MLRRILLAGVLGGAALVLWYMFTAVAFSFPARVELNQVVDERAVHEMLRLNVPEPGAYVVNPELNAAGEFPAGQPVFAIRYSGVGHEQAGRMLLLHIGVAFVSALLAAWLLALASPRVLDRYVSRVLYVGLVGVLLVVFGDLPRYGIGGYPESAALLLAAHHLVGWLLAGLVIAWQVRPARPEAG